MRKVPVGGVVVRVAESRRKRLSELRGLLAPRKGAVEAVRALREADRLREEKRTRHR